jgi:hypothetical protein
MTRAKDISKIVTDADLSGTLDVTGTVTAGGLDIQGDGTISGGSRLTISDIADENNDGIRLDDSTTARFNNLTQDSSGNFKIQHWTGSAWQNNLTVTTGGNVGIGTSSPSEKLEINSGAGNIGAKIVSTDSLAVIAFKDNSTTDVQYLGANGDNLVFHAGTSPSERMRIDSTGRVMIGNTTEGVAGADELTVGNTSAGNGITIRSASNSSGALFFSDGTSGSAEYDGGFEYNHSSQFMRISTAGSEQMRIDSNGNVGIGKTPTTTLDIKAGSPIIQLEDNDASGAYSQINATGTEGSILITADANNAASGTHIDFRVDGSERMRITSAGAMTMGTTTSQTAASGITLKNDVQSGYPTLLFLQNQPGTGGTMGADIHMGYADSYGTILRFYGNPFNSRPGGLQVRRVTGSGTSDISMNIGTDGSLNVQGVYDQTTGSGANVNVASDGHLRRSTSSLRYKNTVNDATNGLTELLTLRPVTYKGNNDGDTVFGGLIAEEVHDAGLTEFVQYDDDGQPDALAYGNMVSLCIKAIQELKTELDEAKARITELETA